MESTAERDQIRHELICLNTKIEDLEISEDERLARELQAIEMTIQETERQIVSIPQAIHKIYHCFLCFRDSLELHIVW